jgi:hypothetical protein
VVWLILLGLLWLLADQLQILLLAGYRIGFTPLQLWVILVLSFPIQDQRQRLNVLLLQVVEVALVEITKTEPEEVAVVLVGFWQELETILLKLQTQHILFLLEQAVRDQVERLQTDKILFLTLLWQLEEVLAVTRQKTQAFLETVEIAVALEVVAQETVRLDWE